MLIIKKAIQTSLLVLFLIFLPLFFVSADAITIDNPLNYDTFGELISAIIGFLFNIALIIAPIIIIIGGYYYLTALGDPAKIETGKRLITYALIGFIIIAVAQGLVYLLMEIIDVKDIE